MNNDDTAVARSRLCQRLRRALLPLLTEGSWKQIEDDHRKVGLPLQAELEPGWGKPKYVERVLDDLPDDEVIAVARRAFDRLAGRSLLDVEDALLWIDTNGVAHISEVTRIALANALDGRRLHPSEGPSDVLGRFARASGPLSRFEYATNGDLVEVTVDIFGAGKSKAPTVTQLSHLTLLDAYQFRHWPDARLFQFLEFLVLHHPAPSRGPLGRRRS